MNNTNNEIINAIDVAKRAQRNYDLTKSIPQKDLETLIYVASNSPSKQNETHFNLRVYTDPVVIKEIYDRTKQFTFQPDSSRSRTKFAPRWPEPPVTNAFLIFHPYNNE